MRSTPMSGHIALCSLGRHVTPVTLHTSVLIGAMVKNPIEGGVELFLAASCYGNRDMLRPDGPQRGEYDRRFTITSVLLERRSVILTHFESSGQPAHRLKMHSIECLVLLLKRFLRNIPSRLL